MAEPLGVIAAGHPVCAQAGADAMRSGGNAVDGALAAMLASFACEPLLTSLGAGGYMLVVEPGEEPVMLDFFVEAPGCGAYAGARATLVPVSVSFGDAIQVFNIGPASVGTYGVAAGVCEASSRFGRIPLAELVMPAVNLARDGVELNRSQAYVIEILAGIVTSTPECAALFAPGGRVLQAGDVVRQPELADALERLGAEGAAPFYTGDIAAAIVDWLSQRGGMVAAEDLAAYWVLDRSPIRVAYRGREVVTNPPPSAGGILIAHALALLDGEPDPLTRPSTRPPSTCPPTRPLAGRRASGCDDGADPGRAHARVHRGARTIRSSSSGSWRGALRSGRPRTSRFSTGRAGRARSRARTGHARAWSCRAPVCI